MAERLSDALKRRKRPVEPHVLHPVAALTEVEAVCRSINHGHAPPSLDDRRSAAADLQAAFTSLGEHTRRLLQPGYHELINRIVPRLPELLNDPGTRVHLIGVVHELRRRLVNEDGLIAAWRDLRAAASAGATDELVRLAGSRLIEVAEACGIEWRWTSTSVGEYLKRGLFDEVEDELRRPTERTAKAAWFRLRCYIPGLGERVEMFPERRLTLRPRRRGAKEPLDEGLPALILLAPFRRPGGVGGRRVVEQEPGLLGLRPVVQPDFRACHPSPSGRGEVSRWSAGSRTQTDRLLRQSARISSELPRHARCADMPPEHAPRCMDWVN